MSNSDPSAISVARLGASVVSVGATILSSSLALGVSAVITARTLGPDERGVFSIDVTAGMLLALIGSFGVGLAGRQMLATSVSAQRVSIRDYHAVKHRLVAIQVPVASVIAIVLLPPLGSGRELGEQAAFVLFATLYLSALLARDALYGVGSSRLAALFTALGSLSQLAAVVIVTLGDPSVTAYLVAFAVGAAVEATLAAATARRQPGSADAPSVPERRTALLRAGPPALTVVLARTGLLRGDRLILGALADPRHVGLYSVAGTATEFLSIGAFAVAQVLFQPVAASSISSSTLRRLRWLAVIGTLIGVAVLVVAAPWLLETLFGADYADAASALRILAIAIVPFALYQIDSYLLAARGRASSAARISVACVVLLLIGNLILVPRYGIEGAAVASLVAYTALALLMSRAVRREH